MRLIMTSAAVAVMAAAIAAPAFAQAGSTPASSSSGADTSAAAGAAAPSGALTVGLPTMMANCGGAVEVLWRQCSWWIVHWQGTLEPRPDESTSRSSR